MKKVVFIAVLILAGCLISCSRATEEPSDGIRPRAIAMWDFSWLERRWPGAGYEDWDKVLDEFVERGYNALRIEAYPQLVAENPEGKWMIEECWNTQDWGSPDMIEIQVQPYLNDFLSKCRDRDIKVGLSSWFRQDTSHREMTIKTPEDMSRIWISTLKTVEEAGLLDVLLYVDLCNEWPGDSWAPFFHEIYPDVNWGQWDKEQSLDWINKSLDAVSEAFPDIPVLYSFDSSDLNKYTPETISHFDLLEHHVWMAQQNGGEFFKETGYHYERFSPEGYKNLAKNSKRVYESRPEYWQRLLTSKVNAMAEKSRELGMPLATTECWGIVDYKDWPMLEWEWVKELCALGTETAASSGQWVAIATSNFCGPQFVGMWSDIEWHRRLTDKIKNSTIDSSILDNPRAAKILKRL